MKKLLALSSFHNNLLLILFFSPINSRTEKFSEEGSLRKFHAEKEELLFHSASFQRRNCFWQPFLSLSLKRTFDLRKAKKTTFLNIFSPFS